MKEFIKKYSLVLAIVAAAVFLIVFLSFIFKKTGDSVYVTSVSGNVSIGTATDIVNLKAATEGMKLTKDDIVVTGDKSSCVLSYEKKATTKDNFINIGENSQVMLYAKNAQGGYKFFVTYGSLICNMPGDRSYQTNISTKLFNLFTDNTITKVTYDNESSIGKVYTFDGNPKVQIIQPSGALNSAEKLLKNSVCAVTKTDNGTIGFGCLNVGFGLNDLTAQDLRTMSGIANTWSEKIAYNADEFENAFQTASDNYKWIVTEPVVVVAPESETSVLNSDTYSDNETTVTGGFDKPSVVSETTADTKPTAATQTVPEQFRDDGSVYSNEQSTNAMNRYEPSVTAFSRDVSYDGNTETTVPDKENDETERTSRGTSAYNKSSETTISSANKSETSKTTSANYNNTSSKTSVTTTVPKVTVNSNAEHTVIFEYNENGTEYWSIQLVKHGKSAIAPEPPVVSGKVFVGWDKDYSCVTSDMTIKAKFAAKGSAQAKANETFKVNFYVGSKLWKTVTVKKGEKVVMSEIPVMENNMTFVCWDCNLSEITSDANVFAVGAPKT